MAPGARAWIDPATGRYSFHGLEDPPQNVRAAVYREWCEEHGGGDVFDDMHEPTGFPNRTDTTISFNDGTRTLTVALTNGSFDIYIRGVKYTFTESQTKQITDTEGVWWFYFDTSGVLTAAQVAPDFRDNALAAVIYWDATNSAALDIADERHGITMDGATHSLLHYTVGTRWESGLAAGDYTIAGDGSADADAQLSIADGVVDDEDLPAIITDDSPQNLDPIAYIPVYYLNGATPDWRKTVADAFPVMDNATDEISYNLDTVGTWSQPPATNNYYVAMWIFATTNVAEPVVAILGQRQDSKLGDAKENNLYESLVFNTLPFQEMKLIYRLIFNTRYPQHSNTPHCKLVDIVDLRSVSNLPAGIYVATAHSSLTGRSDRYSHPASAISLDLTNLDHLLSGLVAPTTDDVQAAMEVLDEIFYGARTVNGDWTWSNIFKALFYDSTLWIYSPADSILEISADGHVRIGANAQGHLAGTADSLLVSGKFEVDSIAYFDSSIEAYNYLTFFNATKTRVHFYETAVADGLVVKAAYDTDEFLLAVGAPCGRQIIVSDAVNYTKDYDHAVQTNPTFYVHSATDPDTANDEWWSITHDVTDAVYAVGSGVHKFTGDMLSHGSAKHYFDAGAAAGDVWCSSDAVGYFDVHIEDANKGMRIWSDTNLLFTFRRYSGTPPFDTWGAIDSPVGWQFQVGGVPRMEIAVATVTCKTNMFIDGYVVFRADNRRIYQGAGDDFQQYFDGANQINYATRITATARHYFGQTATEEAAAAKWHVTTAWTEYAASAAAGYYDLHAATAVRLNADLDVNSNGLLAVASVTMNEDGWIGIGAALERLIFNGGDGRIELAASNLLVQTTGQIQFRDDAIHVASLDDGHLDLTADVSIDVNAPGIVMPDDAWIGIGAAATRFTFDDTLDQITLDNGGLWIQMNPSHGANYPLYVHQDHVGGAQPVVVLVQDDVDQPFLFLSGGTVYTAKTGADEYIKIVFGRNTRYIKVYS